MRAASCLIASLTILAGCSIDAPTYEEPGGSRDADVDTLTDGGPDAVTGHRVGGAVDGLWTPAAVALRLNGPRGEELLTATANGEFWFPSYLESGDSYAVVVETQPASHDCVVFSGNGVIDGQDASSVDVRCDGPVDVEIDLPAPVPFTFVEHRSRSEVPTSLLTQQVSLTVTAPEATTLLVEGMPVATGGSSSPVQLAQGVNELQVRVEAGDFARTWTIAIDRGALQPIEVAQLKAFNPGASDLFGTCVSASLGGYAASSPGEDGSEGGINPSIDEGVPNSGAVYVSSTSYLGSIYLKPGVPAANGGHGIAVAIDGDTLVVGSRAVGAVFVYRRADTPTGWAQEAYLVATNTDPGDAFGSSVDLDGDVLVVGAVGEASAVPGVNAGPDDNSLPAAGAAYVFRRTGTNWAQEAYLKASNPGPDQFGLAVAVSGNMVAVGTYFEDSAATGVNGQQSDESATFAGAVYVFRRSGNLWAQDAYLKASNTQANDRFGFALAMSGDRIAVGAPGEAGFDTGVNGVESDNSAPGSGAVYVFARTAAGWAQEAYVKASNTSAHAAFGDSLDLRGDLLLVGSSSQSGSGSGVGADPAPDGASDSGAAYLLALVDESWTHAMYVKASNAEANDTFGWSVALSGSYAFVGAPYEDSSGQDGGDNGLVDSGAVYVLR